MKKISTVFIICIFFISHNSFASSLWWTENIVSLRFDVNHLSHQELQKLLSDTNKNNVLLFDVRRPEEFQMSRIKGSIQIDPNMSVEYFISLYKGKIYNKEIIFYCSVGYRSSEFIKRIEKQANSARVKKMYNLKGGIFRWYNENHRVINDQGETDNIHPSDESWADLIEKR
ncbi:MAG: rhodanese-like domain-containing protein [Pseudomonadota bacterium]